jgi:hypothetical protein
MAPLAGEKAAHSNNGPDFADATRGPDKSAPMGLDHPMGVQEEEAGGLTSFGLGRAMGHRGHKKSGH